MTITQQKIIALAMEAGFDDITPWLDAENVEQGQIDAANRWIERMTAFAALASAKETTARIKLQKEFMEYQNDMQARGTRLIKEAYQRGVRDEREACAIAAWNHYMDECRRKNMPPADFGEWSAANAIRARGQSCPPCNHNCNQGRDCPGAKR